MGEQRKDWAAAHGCPRTGPRRAHHPAPREGAEGAGTLAPGLRSLQLVPSGDPFCGRLHAPAEDGPNREQIARR